MPKVTRQQGGAAAKRKANGGAANAWEAIDNLDPYIKMALFGRSGTGKTTLLSTFPKPIGTIICSGAGETKSIRNIPNIKANRINAATDLDDLITQQAETGQFKTFAIDHITGYSDLVVKEIKGMEPEEELKITWGTLSQAQWGELATRIKDRLRRFLALPCHTVIIAQEREFNSDSEASEVLDPYVHCAVTPSVAGWIGPNVDYLVQTFLRRKYVDKTTTVGDKKITMKEATNQVEFCLRTAPHPVYMTKFRLPKGTKLPEVIVDPSYEKIAKLIDGAA
jgi:hypothetical protein